MQTFMPYVDPSQTAEVLDNKRLGKQRVEAKQIYDILTKPNCPSQHWKNHPVVRGWKASGKTGLWYLEWYYHAMVKEWIQRGFNNTMPTSLTNLPDDYYEFVNYVMPFFMQCNIEYVEQEYRKVLLSENYEHYKHFWPATAFDIVAKLNYDRLFRMGDYAPSWMREAQPPAESSSSLKQVAYF